MVETTYYEDKVYLPREIRERLGLVDGLNELIEERLIGCGDPTEGDTEAIRKYETAKRNGKLCLAPLKV